MSADGGGAGSLADEPDPFGDEPEEQPPPPPVGHDARQGERKREVEEALADARGTFEDVTAAPPTRRPADDDSAGPSRFLDQLRKQTPFWDLAERVAQSAYPGASHEARMALLRQDRPRFVMACLVGDFAFRAVLLLAIVFLGLAAALKTLAPLPWPFG